MEPTCYDPLTQPTAYQYFTPPIIEFIPQDGTGGGARAEVIVSKGQVLSVDLIDGGSGYTKAPKVIVARRFDILSERNWYFSNQSKHCQPDIWFWHVRNNCHHENQ